MSLALACRAALAPAHVSPPRGHGTQVVDGRLLATTCGAVERVDRLISVRPLQTRSAPCSEALSSQLTACLQI